MNFNNVFSVVGKILFLLSLVQIVPLALAFYYQEPFMPFLASMVISALLGLFFSVRFKNTDDDDWTVRESYAVVALSWLFCALMCAVPFLFFGFSPINAFFESMSGVTTTGSTIISDIEILPRSLLFWRSMTQWLGGLGVVMLFLAVIPKVNIKGHMLYKTEFAGPTEDKISPRISKTAKMLWIFYVGITILMIVLLLVVGVSFYDSVLFSFSTISTGGFAPYNDSIIALQNYKAEIIIIFFMILGATNFLLIYRAATRGIKNLLKDEEFRAFIGFFVLISVVLAILLVRDMGYSFFTSLHYAFFEISTVMTTTGFAIDDHNLWSGSAQMLIFLAMITGSCSGSTAGGPSFFRWIILVRYARRSIFKFMHPNAVKPVKYNGKSLSEEVVHSTISFMILYFLIFIVSAVLLSILGLDFVSAATSSLTSLGNVGPAFGMIGPFDNFSVLPGLSRLIMIFNMWVGRLELYTVILLFTREFWKK